jgi:hypothetical protein
MITMHSTLFYKCDRPGLPGQTPDDPAAIDRLADFMLSNGRAAQAELLAHRAAALRAGVAP